MKLTIRLSISMCPSDPDAEVLRTDARLGKNGRCLRKDQSGATDRAAAKMNKMPIVSVSIVTRVLTHRRDEHPIGKFYFSNRERIKQASHGHRSVTRTEPVSKVQFKSLSAASGEISDLRLLRKRMALSSLTVCFAPA